MTTGELMLTCPQGHAWSECHETVPGHITCICLTCRKEYTGKFDGEGWTIEEVILPDSADFPVVGDGKVEGETL